MRDTLPRCDSCEDCYQDRSEKHSGITQYCRLLGRDIGQSHFRKNCPRDCPKREQPRPPKRQAIIDRQPVQLERRSNGVPVLSGDFVRGYTKAIMDIQEVVAYIQPDLRHHHKQLTAKTIESLLQCCLENREKLRENHLQGGEGFIRFNGQSQKFEWFERGE